MNDTHHALLSLRQYSPSRFLCFGTAFSFRFASGFPCAEVMHVDQHRTLLTAELLSPASRAEVRHGAVRVLALLDSLFRPVPGKQHVYQGPQGRDGEFDPPRGLRDQPYVLCRWQRKEVVRVAFPGTPQKVTVVEHFPDGNGFSLVPRQHAIGAREP